MDYLYEPKLSNNSSPAVSSDSQNDKVNAKVPVSLEQSLQPNCKGQLSNSSTNMYSQALKRSAVDAGLPARPPVKFDIHQKTKNSNNVSIFIKLELLFVSY